MIGKMLQMEYLSIDDVKLGDDGFAAIASCVTNIDQLWIGQSFDPHLSINEIRVLAQGIMERNEPVNYQQRVHFSYNEKFSNISCHCFSTSIH